MAFTAVNSAPGIVRITDLRADCVQIIDKAAAWTEVQTLTAFDNGNTLTNTLYWVATRP